MLRWSRDRKSVRSPKIARAVDHQVPDGADAVLEQLGLDFGKLKIPSRKETLEMLMPRGKLPMRDAVAATAGICTPPHRAVLVEVIVTRKALAALEDLADLLLAAGMRLSQQNRHL